MYWCSQAKNAEAQRKKQLQTVVKMQTDLEQLQRVNARKLKVRVHVSCRLCGRVVVGGCECTDICCLCGVFLSCMQEAVVQAQQAETELQQKIVRETAELT